MNIIHDPSTVDGQKALSLAELDFLIINHNKQFKEAVKKMLAIVWKNKYGLTPVQMMGAMGTNAVKYFELSDLSQTYIYNVDSTLFPTVESHGFSYAKNQDGTVSLTSI